MAQRYKSVNSSIGNISVGGASPSSIGSAFEQAGAMVRPRLSRSNRDTDPATRDYNNFIHTEGALVDSPEYITTLQSIYDDALENHGETDKVLQMGDRLNARKNQGAWSNEVDQHEHIISTHINHTQSIIREAARDNPDILPQLLEEVLASDDDLVLIGEGSQIAELNNLRFTNKKAIAQAMKLDISLNQDGKPNNQGHYDYFMNKVVPTIIAKETDMLEKQEEENYNEAIKQTLDRRKATYTMELKARLSKDKYSTLENLIKGLGEEKLENGIWGANTHGSFPEVNYREVGIELITEHIILNSTHDELVKISETILNREGEIKMGDEVISYEDFANNLDFVENQEVLNKVAQAVQAKSKEYQILMAKEQLRKGDSLDPVNMDLVISDDLDIIEAARRNGSITNEEYSASILQKAFGDQKNGNYGGFINNDMASRLIEFVQRNPENLASAYRQYAQLGLTVDLQSDSSDNAERFISIMEAVNTEAMLDTSGDGYNAIFENMFGENRTTLEGVASTLGVTENQIIWNDDGVDYNLRQLYNGNGFANLVADDILDSNFLEPDDDRINWAEVIAFGPGALITEWGKFGRFNYSEQYQDKTVLTEAAAKYFRIHIQHHGIRDAVRLTKESLKRNFLFDPYVDGYYVNKKHSISDRGFTGNTLFKNEQPDGSIINLKNIIDADMLAEFNNSDKDKPFEPEDLELGVNTFVEPLREATITRDGSQQTGTIYRVFLRTDTGRLNLLDQEGREILHFQPMTTTEMLSLEEQNEIVATAKENLRIQIDNAKYRVLPF